MITIKKTDKKPMTEAAREVVNTLRTAKPLLLSSATAIVANMISPPQIPRWTCKLFHFTTKFDILGKEEKW